MSAAADNSTGDAGNEASAQNAHNTPSNAAGGNGKAVRLTMLGTVVVDDAAANARTTMANATDTNADTRKPPAVASDARRGTGTTAGTSVGASLPNSAAAHSPPQVVPTSTGILNSNRLNRDPQAAAAASSTKPSWQKTRISHSTQRASADNAASDNTRRRIRLNKAPRRSDPTSNMKEEHLTPPSMYRAQTAPVATRVNMLGTAMPSQSDAISRKIQAYDGGDVHHKPSSYTQVVTDEQVEEDDVALLRVEEKPAATTTTATTTTEAPKKKPRHEDDHRPPQPDHDYTEESVSDMGDSVELMDAPDENAEGVDNEDGVAAMPQPAADQVQPGAVRLTNSDAPPVPGRTSFLSRFRSTESSKVTPASNGQGLVAATAVSRDDIEEEVRNELLHNVVSATRVETVVMDEEQFPNGKRTSGTQATYESQDNGNKSNNCCRNLCACTMGIILASVACCCIFIVGISVGVVLALSDPDSGGISIDLGDASETTSPTNAPTKEPDDPRDAFNQRVLQTVLATDNDNAAALYDPTTPQFEAFIRIADYVLHTFEDQKANNETDTIFSDPNLADNLRQRFALTTLYLATDGPNWKRSDNWLSDKSICEWYPASPTQCVWDETLKSFYLRALDLPNNGLNGELVPELAMLHLVEKIELNENSFTNITYVPTQFDRRLLEIEDDVRTEDAAPPESNVTPSAFPAAYGWLEGLLEFKCSRCGLYGTIPPEIGDAGTLRVLELRDNNIFGTLPPQLGDLAKLEQLDLVRNDLTGQLPTTLGQLEALEFLSVARNDINGSVPLEFGQLKSIETLLLDGNELSGDSIELALCGDNNEFHMNVNGTLKSLFADCREISCPCCTQCCVDGRPDRCKPRR